MSEFLPLLSRPRFFPSPGISRVLPGPMKPSRRALRVFGDTFQVNSGCLSGLIPGLSGSSLAQRAATQPMLGAGFTVQKSGQCLSPNFVLTERPPIMEKLIGS